jgi:DNA-binding MarR family transcriptional regulator
MAGKNDHNSQEIADRIHSAAIHLLRKLRREDDASGLNAPRLSALSVVVLAGPVSLGELAAAEQVRPPTMTRIVDALAMQGLVTRKKSTRDGRSTQIAATAQGRQLLFEGRERRVRALAAQIAGLNADERAILSAAVDTLKKVVSAI